MTITFVTPGTIEEPSFAMMGVNAKIHENSIGQFGTGLKYAIAITLRLGGTIRIKTPNHEYQFHTDNMHFRGQDMQRIWCIKNDLDTGESERMDMPYTTHYGHNWKPWMAYRELLSNTRDEKGQVFFGHIGMDPDDIAKSSMIFVDCDEYHNFNMREFFLPEDWHQHYRMLLIRQPDQAKDWEISIKNDAEKLANIEANNGILFVDDPEYAGTIYLRGIRVADDPIMRDAGISYASHHFVAQALREDRTLSSAQYIASSACEQILEYKDKQFHMDLFRKVRGPADKRTIYSQMHSYELKQRACKEMDEAIVELYNNDMGALPNSILKYAYDKGLLSREEASDADSFRKKIREANKITKMLGYNIYTFDWSIVESLDGTTGAIVENGNQIYFSKCILQDYGRLKLAAVMLEEMMHARDQLNDCSRQMQSRLFEMVIAQTVALREEDRDDNS